MANAHKALATQILADEKVLIANRKAMDKVQLQYQSRCSHRDANGSFALIAPSGGGKKSPYTGAPLYRCRICKKELDISNIDEKRFMESLDCINNVIDIGKLQLDLSSEKDQKMLETLGKMQYKLNTVIKDTYETIRKGGRKKKKTNNNPMSGLIEVGR